MKDFNVRVGNRVMTKRLELKWTREHLAFAADINGRFLFDIERGLKGMSAKTLYKLARALDVSADWLLDG